jgi:hypothetical protein
LTVPSSSNCVTSIEPFWKTSMGDVCRPVLDGSRHLRELAGDRRDAPRFGGVRAVEAGAQEEECREADPEEREEEEDLPHRPAPSTILPAALGAQDPLAELAHRAAAAGVDDEDPRARGSRAGVRGAAKKPLSRAARGSGRSSPMPAVSSGAIQSLLDPAETSRFDATERWISRRGARAPANRRPASCGRKSRRRRCRLRSQRSAIPSWTSKAGTRRPCPRARERCARP